MFNIRQLVFSKILCPKVIGFDIREITTAKLFPPHII